ncbi:hypothetical protein AC578_9901 [Pseudocercospora eumusae]|uniref:Amine oxidase domain-containing protein n=1 Tax=Pseudocercospora eumusae TaxID=321146 RepID=A0A139HB81_9PEZI|nr:hypothetical protein AC578_9901 [Pseudocercospora eumusae]
MSVTARGAFAVFIQLAAAFSSQTSAECENVLDTDVVILGGGASGSYALVTLSDLNFSVILVEQSERLGGHINTWIEPETGTPVNYGVQTYWDWGPAKPFFARMGVNVAPSSFPLRQPYYVDEATGVPLPSYKAPSESETRKALATYLKITEEYSRFMVPGYWDFPSGHDIPADLLLPFGEFSAKYELDPLVPLITKIALTGVGGIKDIPTFEIMGPAFGLIPAHGISENSSFGPASGDNSELYQKVGQEFARNILLSSTIVATERNEGGVTLIVQNVDGKKSCVKAQKLLITATPNPLTLPDIDLDDKERQALTGWTPRALFVGVLQTFAIPGNRSIYTMSSQAVPSSYINYQQDAQISFAVQAKEPKGHGVFRVMLESTQPIGVDEAQELATKTLRKILDADPFPELGNVNKTFQWRAWDSHQSILMRQSSAEIQAGFVRDLYSVQGYRSTWWSGSLFSSDFSTCVWTFTESLIARMVSPNNVSY